MRLIYPKDITLVSSNVSESAYNEWSDSTDYTDDDKVYVTQYEDGTARTPHKIYEALQASGPSGAGAKYPPDYPAYWQDQGGTNRWKMFDEYNNTQTTNTDTIEVEINSNNCDRIALFNMDAYSVDLALTDNATASVVQTKSIDLSTSDGDYQRWIIESIYIYANATLKVTINRTGATAKCGLCGIGTSTYLGTTQFGVNAGLIDYSKKETNDSGQTYLAQGNWAKDPEITFTLPWGAIDDVFDDLTEARGKRVIIEANEDTDFEAIRAYGFIEEWRIILDNYARCKGNINFQGVI